MHDKKGARKKQPGEFFNTGFKTLQDYNFHN
jgi:hypothetical protein